MILLMSELKIFIFDLDGTLLKSDNSISEKNIQTLQKAKSKGHKIAIATGRSFIKTKPVQELIPFVDFFICNNGNVIVDNIENHFEIKEEIDPSIYDLAKETALSEKMIFYLDTNKNSYVYFDNEVHKNMLDPKYPMDLHIANNVSLNVFDDAIYNKKEKITQMALRHNPLKAAEIIKKVKSDVQGKVEVTLTNHIYVDINPLGTNKSNSLIWFKNHLSTKNMTTVAFGDSGNDLEMIKNADIGVAMGNAGQDVKDIANIVIGDNETDAISSFIEGLI
ncbi:hypothetical protein EI74_0463 [Mycoplasma testudineum]|uniref:Cof subfamily protein (Haloacid dehalogenase superfamily)/HAD superfamily hydrolase (TIGR01484 family) n=2 Tax=Mycoplasma testudineum TaxID=244584 RepID=A0A4R6IH77_9MOLU|nr:hypothetical protein EI74_0463 [Mycoplasma testudineum]